MKTIIEWMASAIIKTLCLAIILSTQVAYAKDLSVLKIYVFPQATLEETCKIKDIWGCYNPNYNEVFLDDDIPAELFSRVLFHEVGHFYLWGEDLSLFGGDAEAAAESFSDWMIKIRVDEEKAALFKKLTSLLN